MLKLLRRGIENGVNSRSVFVAVSWILSAVLIILEGRTEIVSMKHNKDEKWKTDKINETFQLEEEVKKEMMQKKAIN